MVSRFEIVIKFQCYMVPNMWVLRYLEAILLGVPPAAGVRVGTGGRTPAVAEEVLRGPPVDRCIGAVDRNHNIIVIVLHHNIIVIVTCHNIIVVVTCHNIIVVVSHHNIIVW